ncbi:MAG: hypothetical protein V4506_10000 [Bacteroidota bacterium]
MEVVSVISTGFKTFIGALIPPIKKKYFDQPRIYFVLKFDSSGQRSKGISSRNDLTSPTFVTEVIYNFELTWDYQISFRNNSEYTAYNLKLIKPVFDKSFKIIPNIDSFKPLSPNNEINAIARFSLSYEGTGTTSEIILKNKPAILTSGEFIVEYTNANGTKFITKYNNKLDEDKRHQFVSVNFKKHITIIISAALLIFVGFFFLITFFSKNAKDKSDYVNLQQDAKTVTKSIVLTGWENAGDYFGYLSQITGFYDRHKQQFPSEYNIYKKQLDSWGAYIEKNRNNDRILYSYDIADLKGLVVSGEKHLEQLADSKNDK